MMLLLLNTEVTPIKGVDTEVVNSVYSLILCTLDKYTKKTRKLGNLIDITCKGKKISCKKRYLNSKIFYYIFIK